MTEKASAAVTVLSLLPLLALIVYLEGTGQFLVALYPLVSFVGVGSMQIIRSFVQGGR